MCIYIYIYDNLIIYIYIYIYVSRLVGPLHVLLAGVQQHPPGLSASMIIVYINLSIYLSIYLSLSIYIYTHRHPRRLLLIIATTDNSYY